MPPVTWVELGRALDVVTPEVVAALELESVASFDVVDPGAPDGDEPPATDEPRSPDAPDDPLLQAIRAPGIRRGRE
jgi:hypothetical protein